MKRQARQSILVHVVLILLMVPLLFPFYWMVASSGKPFIELLAIPPTLIPDTWSLEPYRQLLSEFDVLRHFRNSALLAVGTAFGTALVGMLAAYSLTAYRYRGQVLLSRLVLFIYMFPHILVVIPLYLLMTRLGLINTHFGVLLVYLAFSLPLSIWVLKAYFESIPAALIEAAEIDGASRVSALFRIVLPIALPGIAAAAILAFIHAWNEFLFANTFLVDEALKTFPVIIADYNSRESVQWNGVLAASFLISIPSFLFALFAQRYLVSGLSQGSVK